MTARPSSGSLRCRCNTTSVSAPLSCDGLPAWLKSMRLNSWRLGMPSSPSSPGERVKDVRCTDDLLVVDLVDGRTISVPLAWYPRLLHATAGQRANWRIAGAGFGIHWPDIDE